MKRVVISTNCRVSENFRNLDEQGTEISIANEPGAEYGNQDSWSVDLTVKYNSILSGSIMFPSFQMMDDFAHCLAHFIKDYKMKNGIEITDKDTLF